MESMLLQNMQTFCRLFVRSSDKANVILFVCMMFNGNLYSYSGLINTFVKWRKRMSFAIIGVAEIIALLSKRKKSSIGNLMLLRKSTS